MGKLTKSPKWPYFQNAREITDIAAILIVFSGISPYVAHFLFKGLPGWICGHLSGVISDVGAADFLLDTSERHRMLDDLIVISIEISIRLTDERIRHLITTGSKG